MNEPDVIDGVEYEDLKFVHIPHDETIPIRELATKVPESKHRLTILDALTVQYHRGPSYHARWARKLETLVFSLDPVAADAVGRTILDELRAAEGLPSLVEDNREPHYLQTAQSMGLGRANLTEIDILELSI